MQNLRKELRKLAAPIWVEVMLMMLVGATDTFMLGHYSDSAVAAVGVVNQLVNLAFLVFQVINIGTLVMCSQYIGAQQNALEHTINNNEATVENTRAAESRIRDTDMAKEMVSLSLNNILQQVGDTMMSQANQSREGILALLR